MYVGFDACLVEALEGVDDHRPGLSGVDPVSDRRLPPDIARCAVRKLSAVDAATTIDDLRVPPGNRLHALEGDRTGQHAVSIDDQWRVCFRFEDGDVFEVEVCDYHQGVRGRSIA